MKPTKLELVFAVFVFLVFFSNMYLYPVLQGEVKEALNDSQIADHLSRFWDLFVTPMILVGLFLLFSLMPRVSTLKEVIGEFRGYYDQFFMVLLVFNIAGYANSMLKVKGYGIEPAVINSIGFALSYFSLGILLSRVKRNKALGIITDAAAGSQAVWDKTHNFGALLFKISAVIPLLGIIFKKYTVVFASIPFIIIVAVLIKYSIKLGKELK